MTGSIPWDSRGLPQLFASDIFCIVPCREAIVRVGDIGPPYLRLRVVVASRQELLSCGFRAVELPGVALQYVSCLVLLEWSEQRESDLQ